MTPYSIHMLDGGRVLVAVGLTLTDGLRDRIVDQVRVDVRIAGAMIGGYEIPFIEVRQARSAAPFWERDLIEIRALLAAHAAEPVV